MRILFTGGGTGGHVYPIIAVKKALEKQENIKFLYVGPDDFAVNVFKEEGIKCKFILAGKFRRYFSLLNLIDLLKIPVSIIQSLWHIFWFMPDIVFSKGGYGSISVVFTSWLYKIPIITHDSDAVPGLVNRKMAKFAKRIILSFESAKKYFKLKQQNKIVVIGNPIRKELICERQTCLPAGRELFKISTNKPVVLILGSSQGAQKINEIVINTLPRLVEIAEIIHGCGKENFKEIKKETGETTGYHLYPFLDVEQMKHALALADLVINRAGAGSIFEIAACGKPSILIPLPSAAQEHQKENAFEFSKISGAIVLDQENLTPNLFLTAISNLLNNPDKLRQMSEKAKTFYNPNTPELIGGEILKFYHD